MILAKDVQIYVKATETCNLNCSHCFTSGINGKKIYFNADSTARFLTEMSHQYGLNSMRLIFHGGEPMLCPLESLYSFYEQTKDIKGVQYGIQTNLVYKLTSEKKEFFKRVISTTGIGTSWDHDVRFGSVSAARKESDLSLWENNVRELVQDGHELTLMVCLSSSLIKSFEPSQILEYAISLGFKYILFERLTSDGNAKKNDHLFPENADLDQWIYKMYHQTMENRYFEKIGNMFLDEIATSFLKRAHVANRCRGCEQKLMTINADGSIAGCPNSASNENWGRIDDKVSTFVSSPQRVNAICKEKIRNNACLSCDVSDLCNGDCYKLPWDSHCPAPKSLFQHLKFDSHSIELNNLLLT